MGGEEFVGVYDLRCRTYRIRRDDIDSEAVGRISEKQGDAGKVARKVGSYLARNYFGSCYPTRSKNSLITFSFKEIAPNFGYIFYSRNSNYRHS